MKKLTFIFLLCAGTLLSLAGCQEKSVTPDGDKKGQLVEFAAVAGDPATRTAYSGEGEGTYPNLSWERIDWIEGDQIWIWSDKATSKAGSGNASKYSILSVTAAGKESRASISDPNGTGLRYAAEGGDHQFWGVYPATAIATTPTASTTSVSFDIPAEQTGTKEVDANGNISIKPNMDHAVMLAAIKDVQPKQKVDVPFYPAFTAFELTFKVDENYYTEAGENADPVILHHVTLESTTGLAGTVAATLATGTRTFTVEGTNAYAYKANGKSYTVGASTYEASNTTQRITFNLPEAVELTRGKELKMTIVTLPQDIYDLTIGMHMGQDGKDVRLGKLKIGTGADKKNLAFAACQKHCIRGVLVRPNDWEFSYITLDIQVLDWDAVDVSGVSSEFPQATQFAVTGEGVKNGDSDLHLGGTGDNRQKDPYRQQWYFVDGQTVTVFFKIMLPVNGTWELEPVGGTEENPVEGDKTYFTFKNAYDETDTTPLDGPIGSDGNTAVKINITYNGPAEEAHTFYFHSYAIDENGNKYNIDSETQIYDRGRGYHTFFVNSPLYNNQ